MEGHILTASKKRDLERQTKKALKEGWQLQDKQSVVEIPTRDSSRNVFYQEIKKI